MTAKANWTYSPDLDRAITFIDPRIAVARHIGWEKYTGPDTVWFPPEPDNYNFAIFAAKPIECKFISHQVIYYDNHRQGWFTLMLVDKQQEPDYFAWLKTQTILAHWYHPTAPEPRPRRNLLRLRGVGDPTKDVTLNERLYTMNYFEKFASKYSAATTIVSSRVGLPRDNLYDLIEDQSSLDLVKL